ncbi:MAG TPA: HAD family hydrolase [Paludibacteraceae bacterium]|nr:HAD family hydrolase [Paludibacteraceae bacterium]
MVKNAVLIDICGTLFYSNTTFDFLDFYINQKSYRRFRKLMQTSIWRYSNSLIYRLFNLDLSRTIALSYLKGFSHTELVNMANSFYENYLSSRRICETWELLEQKRPTNELILVSGTIDPIAETVAKKIGVQQYISSTLNYNNDICQGKLKYDALRNKAKCLANLNIQKPYTLVITDNPGDVSLIEHSQEAVIILYNNQQRWQRLIKKQRNIHYITPSHDYKFHR